jgi:hypothetical protein
MVVQIVFETHQTTEDNEVGIATGWLRVGFLRSDAVRPPNSEVAAVMTGWMPSSAQTWHARSKRSTSHSPAPTCLSCSTEG